MLDRVSATTTDCHNLLNENNGRPPLDNSGRQFCQNGEKVSMKIAAKFCSAIYIYNLHLQWNRFEPVVGEECGLKVDYWTKNAKTFPSLTSKLRILPCAQDIDPP